MRERPDELCADFQQFYGMDTDEIGRSIKPSRAARLAAQLPRGARVWVRPEDPDSIWGDDTRLLSLIEYWAHSAFLLSLKPEVRRQLPDAVLIRPGATGGADAGSRASMPADELWEYLHRPRVEV